MMDTMRRMSAADQAGFQARSPEGHAARSMSIKGQEEVWVQIQANTFKNWANVSLREAGIPGVDDLQTGFQDGTKLVALVETLQKRRLKHNKKPLNQHHELENISIALDAIQEDGIKLVNIGNTDIHNGNLKLILALLWSLIAHYQLGASNFPPKKLMLAWLKAVLPETNIKNFTSDWSNGINLSALLDYCQPGLMPNWRNLNPNDGPNNCQRAMEVAEKHFKIPMVLEPEYLASPHLDELSGMTYLSYFMKEEDSPGYYATLNWVKNQIPHQRVNNFRTDWNDGLASAALVKAKGGPVPNFREMDNHPENWVSNLDVSINGGNKIGVPKVLDAKDMANPNVEYLGVMAWVAQFQWIPDKTPPGDRLEMRCNLNKIKVGEECNFNIDILDKEVDMDAINAEVIGPSGPVYLNFDLGPNGGRGSFQPDEMGMHEVLVTNEGEAVRGAPHFLRSMPKSKKDYDGIEPCAVGSTVEVLINPHHAAKPELLEVTAYSPTSRPLGCPVSEENGTFYASFQPEEAGEWKIHVTYDGQDIEHSPFKCMVFNPRAIFIPDQESARKARPGDPFTFTVDASKTGWGEVAIDVVYDNRSIRRTFYVEEVGNRIYNVTFTPQEKGKHRVYVYLHGMEVKGSPFSLRIGKDVREPRTGAKDLFRPDRKVSRYKTHDESKAERRNYYSEREIPVSAPQAPPRSKRKRQSFREFREENQTQNLFQSEHQTEDGSALLPINKIIAFDCPADGATASEDIFVGLKDPNGKKIASEVQLNPQEDTFTCEFTTSTIGQHLIEIVIKGDRIDATPGFYTYDASKIRVGEIPPGLVGMPVEFQVEGNGAGFGNLEIVVNGGRASCHVSRIEQQEKFSANFIPHEAGRHRLDVTFNGDKVPHSPWFCEVKDPNLPLMSPGLLTGKVKAKDITNGLDHNKNINNNWEDKDRTLLHSKDFSKIDSTYLDDYSNSQFVTKTTEITTTKKESTIKNSYTKQPPARNTKIQDETDLGPVVKSNISEKKSTVKMDPVKDFGNFSSLMAPALLSGKKNSQDVLNSSNSTTNNTSFTNNNKSIIEKESTSFNLEDSKFNTPTYSTTLNTQVKNNNNTNGFKEESFLIKTTSDSLKSNGFQVESEYKESKGYFGMDNRSNKESSSPVAPIRSSLRDRSKSPVAAPVRSSLRDREIEFNNRDRSKSPARSKSPPSSSSNNLFQRDRSKSPKNTGSNSSGLFGNKSRDRSKSPKRSSLFQSSRDRSKSPDMMDELSRNPLFNESKIRSQSPTIEQSTPPPVERNLPIRRDDNRSSSEKPTIADFSHAAASILKEKSPVPNKRKTPPPPARKNSSPGRSLIPKRTSSAGAEESKKSFSSGSTRSVSQSKQGIATSTSSKSFAQYSEASSATRSSSKSKTSTSKSSKEVGPKKGSTSPKLPSYRGMADNCRFEGETVRHFNAGKLAVFEMRAPNCRKDEIQVNIISPEKRPKVPYKVVDESNGRYRIEFTTVEVGSYVIDVTVKELTVPNSPLIAKAYDAGLIKVTDIQDGIVGDLSTFRVDASKAGEGQLEISINDGDVPNAVQVLGGGKCLVTYTPEQPITHEIEVTFNGEQVPGSPFLCRIMDPSNSIPIVPSGSNAPTSGGGSRMDPDSLVAVELEHLGLIPISEASQFTIRVAGGDDAELAVSVQGPTEDIPVKVTGNVKNGFTAEFVPIEVGIHMILVEYNGVAVGGTPYYSKAYDNDSVAVSDIPRSSAGKTVTFAVDASEAGEGSLEILVKSTNNGQPSLPTQVESLGNAVFNVSFMPDTSIDHLIHVTFNDEPIPGSPFVSFANEQYTEGQQIHPNHHRALQQEYYYSKKNTMHEGIEYFNDFLTTNKPQPGSSHR